ncbi:DUF421 domain-containing protein [Mesobacillus subterraneus]|uniref:DUF421 domain-containing protein n=1 Tax=Mesobacillus subterraneus TaxID=285983 RepID=A0A427TXL4_9BACI|nr:DUF421 domain-containing protein [Mesobacillus subterraneus]RSD29219.1 DUF421 domain-containing protein [Mesobacillus subterraneus]
MVYPLIAVKLVIGLSALIAVTRLLGKKEMSQVTPFDFVYAIVLGGLVEENLFEKSPSTIWEMLFGIAVWGILIFIVEKATQKSDKLRPILKGRAEPIVKNGEVLIQNLEKAELEMEQLKSLLRLKGVFSMKEVKDVILETSGDISVLLKPEAQATTYAGLHVKAPSTDIPECVVDEGEISHKGLENIGENQEWLMEKLAEEGHKDVSSIYYAEWSEADGLYVQQMHSS